MSEQPPRPVVEETSQPPSAASTSLSGAAMPTASVMMLKALAHPVRQRLFGALTSRGHARATDLASDLGLPVNQVSFHLRVLADAEIIEEAPEHARDRRDRVWAMRPGGWELGRPERPVADEALGGVITQWVAADLEAMIQRLLAWAPEYTSGRASDIHGSLARISMWLTEDEFGGLLDELGEVIDRFKERHKPGEPGSRHWQIAIIAADDDI